MGLESTPDWEEAADAIAGASPREYMEIAAWMKVVEAGGIEDGPIASIDMAYGVFEFETKRICVLAIWPHGADPILTHIFVKDGPAAINGRLNRARAAARAIGLIPMMIV